MFKTNPVSLKQLLDNVDSGKIQLPDFQRGWVWDDDRIRGLLASVSSGFPVGAIMTLEAGGEIRLKSRMIEGAERKAGIGLTPSYWTANSASHRCINRSGMRMRLTPTTIVDDAFGDGTTLTC